MSENEQEVPFEEPDPSESGAATQPDEVPEGVDPETGEVTDGVFFDSEDEDQQDAAAVEAALAADRQRAEQERAATEAEIEKQGKALDRATKAYTDKLLTALGDDLGGWQPCPMCADSYPGIRQPVMPSPEALAKVKIAIGEDPDPTLETDSYSRPCDKCDGYGKVSTGSHVAGHKSVLCLDCGGKGYIAVGTERDSVPVPAPNGSPVPLVPQPLTGDPPRTPEEETLRQLGAIVVWPPKPPDMATLGG